MKTTAVRVAERRKRRRWLFCTLGLLLAGIRPAYCEGVSEVRVTRFLFSALPPKLYQQTRDLWLDIHQDYPTPEYYYLYPGRSLPLVSRFQENLTPGSSKNIPFSGAYFPGASIPAARDEKLRFEPLTAEQEEVLFNYFDHVLPSDAELAGRKLLVVDYVNQGNGIKSFLGYLQLYSIKRGRHFELKGLGISETINKSRAKEIEKSVSEATGVQTRVLDKGNEYPELLLQMNRAFVEPVAEYGRADPGSADDLLHLRRRRSYDLLGFRLYEAMKNDPVLQESSKSRLWISFTHQWARLKKLAATTKDLDLIKEYWEFSLDLTPLLKDSGRAREIILDVLRPPEDQFRAQVMFEKMLPRLSREDAVFILRSYLKNERVYGLYQMVAYVLPGLADKDLTLEAIERLSLHDLQYIRQFVFPHLSLADQQSLHRVILMKMNLVPCVAGHLLRSSESQ